jgi:hypothetical protein
VLRTYRNGDEIGILKLWHRAYAEYGGFAVRSVEHWLWAILNRPGVQPQDILLVESGDGLQAYGALGPDGAILEFVVDPGRSRRERRSTLGTLLQGLEQRARDNGCDAIVCVAPASDRFVGKFLLNAGYYVRKMSFFCVGVADMRALIQRLLDNRRRNLRGWRQVFLLELSQGSYQELPQSRISIEIGDDIHVTEGTGNRRGFAQCKISAEVAVMTDVIFRSASARSCLASGAITVHPPAKSPEALRLLEELSIKAPWHAPSSDAF